MPRFSRFVKLLTSAFVASALLLNIHAGSRLCRASDDDDDEKSAPKTVVQKERSDDEKLFETLDENEDGWLSGNEMKAYKAYDVDNNGQVTKIEFLAGQAKARLGKIKPAVPPSEAPPIAPPAVPAAPPATPAAPPAALPNNAILPALGSLAASQTVLMHRHLSLLTTACEKGLLTGKETEQRVLDVAQAMPIISDYLTSAKANLSKGDKDFITSIQDIHQLLRTQAQSLVAYARQKDDAKLSAVREAEATALARMQKLFGATAGGGGTTPASNDPEVAVNAAALEGNKLSEQAGKKFTAIFADEQLNAFPGNRAEFKKNAQRVAELLASAATQYRAAAVLCDKASQKAPTPNEARYWSLKGRSFRRIAESKEGFRSVALLIEDETVTDRATFESRAKPLVDEAVEVNSESQKLSKQAAELWNQIHPEK